MRNQRGFANRCGWTIPTLLAVVLSVGWAQGEVKVGYILPLSGSSAASLGQELRNGAELAIRHINSEGGIASLGGALFNVLFADSRGDPEVAMTEAERLITVDNVVTLLGSFQSSVTLPATTVAERHKVPWIVDLAAEKTITQRGFEYVFRPTQIPSSGNADSIVGFVEWASAKTGKKPATAALIFENTDWGQGLATRMRELLQAQGIQIVLDESYAPNAANLRPLALKLRRANADLVSVTSYAADAFQIHSLIAQLQIDALAVIGSGAGQVDAKFISTVGEEATDYVLTTNGWAGYESTITTPFAERFWKDYVDTYGVEPNSEFPFVGYSVIWILKDALERAGSADPRAIRDALATTEMRGNDIAKLLGYDVVIDATGQNPEKVFAVQQIKDGKYYTVWPEAVADDSYELVWPMPAWADR